MNLTGQHDDSIVAATRAIEEYRAAVRADPNLAEARVRLADQLRASGQLQASLEHYEVAVKLDPGLVEAWIGGDPDASEEGGWMRAMATMDSYDG